MRSRTSAVAAVIVAGGLMLATRSSTAAATCPAGLAGRTQIELYFGRNIGETLAVDADAWARFVDEEITPRFPDGLSVIDLDGQWKDRASGRIVREPGKKVVIIVDSFEIARERVAAIIDRYKSRHQQQAVLVTARDICAAD